MPNAAAAGGTGEPKKDREPDLTSTIEDMGGPRADIIRRTAPAVMKTPAEVLDHHAKRRLKTVMDDWDPIYAGASGMHASLEAPRPDDLINRINTRRSIFQNEQTADFINWRLQAWDPDIVKAVPGQAWKAAMNSGLNDRDLELLANKYAIVVPWVQAENSVSGEPGMLSKARVYALSTNNKAALEYLDVVKTLDPTAQRIWLQYMREPNPLMTQALTGGGTNRELTIERLASTVPGLNYEEAQAFADAGAVMRQQFGFHIEIDPMTRKPVAAWGNTNAGSDAIVAAQALFPKNPLLWTDSIEGPGGFDEWVMDPVRQAGEAAGMALRDVSLVGGNVTKILRSIATKSLNRGAELGAALSKHTIGLTDQEASRALAETQYYTEGISGEVFHTWNTFWEKTMDVSRFAVRHTVLEIPGLSDEQKAAWEEPLAAGLLWGASWAAERGMHAFHEGKYDLPTTARAELGIDAPFNETVFGRGNAGIIDKMANPFQTVGNLVNRLGYSMAVHGRSLAEIVQHTGFIQKAFDVAHEINQRYPNDPDARVGALMLEFGEDMMPRALAERIANAGRGEMEMIYMDHFEGSAAAARDRNIPTPQRHNDQQERIHNGNDPDVVNARRQGIQDNLTEAAELTRRAELLRSRPRPEGTFNQAITRLNEVITRRRRGREESPTFNEAERGLSDMLDRPDNTFQTTFNEMRDTDAPGLEHLSTDDRNRQVYRFRDEETGQTTYYGVDGDTGRIRSMRIESGGEGQAFTAAAATNAGWGGLLNRQVFEDLGIETEADLMAYIERQDLSEDGARLVESQGRRLLERLYEDPDALDARAVEAERAAQDLVREHVAAQNGATDAALERAADAHAVHERVGSLDDQPAYKYPRNNRLKTWVLGHSTGAWGRFGEMHFGRSLRQLASFTIDDLPNNPVLYVPFGRSSNRPLDWIERNVETLGRYLTRAKVPNAVRDSLVGQMAEARTIGEWNAWKARAKKAIYDSLPPNTPESVKRQLTDWFDDPLDHTTHLTISEEAVHPWSGRRTTRVRSTTGRSPLARMPGSPFDMQGFIQLPDVDLLISATSTIRRGLRAGMSHGRIAQDASIAAEALFDTVKGFLGAGTGIWKAPILALRIPAMMQRIQLEQDLRAHLFGGHKGVIFFPGGIPMPGPVARLLGERWDWLIRPDANAASLAAARDMDLGSIHQQLTGQPGQNKYIQQDMTLYNSRRKAPKPQHFVQWVQGLADLAKNPFYKQFAKVNLDPRAMRAWIESDPEISTWLRDEQLPILRENNPNGLNDEQLITNWLEDTSTALQEYTGGDALTIRAIHTGRLTTPSALAGRIDVRTGQPLDHYVADLVHERNEITRRLRTMTSTPPGARTPGDIADIEALQVEARRVQARIRNYELEEGFTAEEIIAGQRGVKLSDVDSAAGIVADRYREGTFNFPSTMGVKEHYHGEEKMGLAERARRIQRGWNEAWYRPYRLLSEADLRGTRGSLFAQLTDKYHRDLRARGYDETSATALAQAKGAREVRDLMYDLSARSSLHRALKDVFWFAPAAQEVMYTYFAKLPGSRISGIGSAVAAPLTLGLEIESAYTFFKAMGFIQEDEQGEDYIPFGFLNNLLPGADKTYRLPTKSVNLVLSSPVPGLSTLPGWLLGKAGRAFGSDDGLGRIILNANHFFNQYGSDITSTPKQIVELWEAASKGDRPFPLEFLSPAYSKAMHDRAMDMAIQYAVNARLAAGETPPRPEDFGDVESYKDAYKAWFSQTMSDARDYHATLSWTKLGISIFAPGSIRVSETERTEWNTFYTTVLEPLEDDEPGWTEEQHALLDEWLGEHPYSMAYTVGYTAIGDTNTEKQLNYTYNDTDQEFYEKLYTGEARVREPDEYLRWVMANESYRFYTAQKQAALDSVGSTASELLENGWQKTQAMRDFYEDWARYGDYNPEAVAMLDENRQLYADTYGLPTNSFEVHRLSDTMHLLDQISPLFTGETGIRMEEFRTVRSQLGQLYNESDPQYTAPTTEVGRQMQAFYTTVLDPYFEKTEPIYDLIAERSARGLDVSSQYDQLRQINNSYDHGEVTINGESFPTPEEVFFNNKPKPEQQAAVWNWQTKPMGWLTDFQLDQTGIVPEFEGRSEMMTRLNNFDKWFHNQIESNDVSPTSLYYDQLQEWSDNQKAGIAAEYGTEGTALYNLDHAVPAERLTQGGFLDGNEHWSQLVAWAAQVNQRVTAGGDSIRGYSTNASYYKSWFFKQIESMRATDNQLDRRLTELGYAIPDKGMTNKDGVPLYDAVFFGNYSSDFIPEEILAIGDIGA